MKAFESQVEKKYGKLAEVRLFAQTGASPEKLAPGTLVRVVGPVDGPLGRDSEMMKGQAPDGTTFRVERSNGFVLSGYADNGRTHYVVDARNKDVEILPNKGVEMYGNRYEPQIGTRIKIDGWPFGVTLRDGDHFSTFRVPVDNGGPIKSLAVEVAVTGRTPQRFQGESAVRIRVTFPGDGEPDTVTSGWMWLEGARA